MQIDGCDSRLEAQSEICNLKSAILISACSAWGFRLRALPALGREQAYSSACRDVARDASEVGIVPDNLKEQPAIGDLASS